MKRNPAPLAGLVLVSILGFVLIQEPELRGTAPVGLEIRKEGKAASQFGDISGRRSNKEAQNGDLPGKELSPALIEQAVEGDKFRFELPDGREARGTVVTLRRDGEGVSMIEGRLSDLEVGRFFFLRQTVPGVAGSLVGHILFDGGDRAWKVEPSGPGGAPQLVETRRGEVICTNYLMPAAAAGPEEAPADHPIDIPIPAYQDIVPLQSLPGAAAVIYLDFDGEPGPFPSWGNFNAAAPNVSNGQVHAVWKMVCEDFQGFTLNITTDRKVFDEAAPGSRQHVIITPTTAAAPNAGGVAYLGSFNWVADVPCWAFYSTGKYSAEVISHEVGHTLGLGHDGRVAPAEEYSLGHGGGETGWAPIMGAGYYQNVTQWSKGEYASANNNQDDLATITTNNNVQYRPDDTGDEFESGRYLEIAADSSVANEGIIETPYDVDAFRFRTTGGMVTLQVNPVAANPNLDVLAELVDADSGDYLVTSHPDATLGAGISIELAAGEYVLEVSGSGRGNPLTDGYTDYGSLGTYSISGSIPGAETPERFEIAEHSSTGATVGTIAARNDHGSSVLTWSIASGNSAGAFTIDEATGLLSVADADALDFELLSPRWDDPGTYELFVTITDADAPGLNETVRVVVTLEDVNDPPVVIPAEITVLERTRPGTPVVEVKSSDPDHFDLPSYSIIGGNEAGWFTIDPDSGILSVSGDGIGEVEEAVTVTLTVRVGDRGSPALAGTAAVTLNVADIPDGHVPGGITRTYYEGIAGDLVSDLTAATAQWPDRPDGAEFLPAFDAGTHGDSFGSSFNGYFIPPVSGDYQFWIASDGASELRIDPTTEQTGLVTVASVIGATDPWFWIETAPFRSEVIPLVAGRAYAIEALQKESGGPDHLSVAFSGPGMPKQLLGGLYLAPRYRNYAPEVVLEPISIREDAYAGQPVGTVKVDDVNEQDSHAVFEIAGGNEDGVFEIDPDSGQIRIAARGAMNAELRPSYTLAIQVRDNGTPALTGAGEVTIGILPAEALSGQGVRQQVWTGIGGATVADLTGSAGYPDFPEDTRILSSFDSGLNTGDNYGSRIRALVTPPVTGYYTFYISSNDQGKLRLGTGPTASGASQIASVTAFSNPGQWTKYAAQQSDPVHLVAGMSYYIEALQKEGAGSDHVQVAWTGPDISTITIIPGSRLTPYDINVAPIFAQSSYGFSILEGSEPGTPLGTVETDDAEDEELIHEILSGNAGGAFAIDPQSGALTVADSAALSPGEHALTIGVQDGGLGREYPFKTATVSATITVMSNNQAPQFAEDGVSDTATEDVAYAGVLAATDPDAGDVVNHEKVSGPEWLVVESDGSLHGVPGNADVGTNAFVIRATDPEGLQDEVNLSIAVENTNDPPFLIELPLAVAEATQGEAFVSSLAGTVADIDANDVLSFVKQSGPEWLVIAADGSLSGMPALGPAGTNVFTVRVTDLAGLHAEATLVITVAGTGLPLPWEGSEIGLADAGFSKAYGPGEFLVAGSGQLAARDDAFHFIWQPLSGDGTITARVEAMEDSGLLGRAGVMIRDTLAANSRHVFLGLAGDGSYRWVRRTGLNGYTSNSTSGRAAFPDAWVRLVRSGNTITAYKSSGGTNWVQIGSLNAALPETCYFGLVVAGSGPAALNEVRFSHVSVAP